MLTRQLLTRAKAHRHVDSATELVIDVQALAVGSQKVRGLPGNSLVHLDRAAAARHHVQLELCTHPFRERLTEGRWPSHIVFVACMSYLMMSWHDGAAMVDDVMPCFLTDMFKSS